MHRKEFSGIRSHLNKTQDQLAKLLVVSTKTVQAYEQGWKNIPPYIERQMLLLFALKGFPDRNIMPCWEIKNCPKDWKDNCIVWELKARHFCWYMTGTFCQGKIQNKWETKMKLCRNCEVYQSMFPNTYLH
jgi:DNA-binding XRE family transcriptional regulator